MNAQEGVVYRPPLWSQNSEYSAADDRRLIMATLRGGVIDLDDLRVVPRQEGSNMSVDVLPGHVVIPGTDQADQGHYVCPLAQRVNVPIPAGPSAGNWRRDRIYARVYEPGGEEEAYWRCEVLPGTSGPTSAVAPFLPDHPPSAVMLCWIEEIASNTVAINADRIVDFRKLARPASMGECIIRAQALGQTAPPPGTAVRWDSPLRIVAPLAGPVDVEVTAEGTVWWNNAGAGSGTVWVSLYRDLAGQNPELLAFRQPADIGLFAQGVQFGQYVKMNLVVEALKVNWYEQLYCEAVVQNKHGGWGPVFTAGQLTMRITPSGTALT
ncbi:MAG: hypothetical protein FWD42_01685 [Solirubrobacterales bacterium]|nr:hypothetical protein [Solirubrobacterales bacterium]